MKRICVFCGSSEGSRPEYGTAVEELAGELVRRKIGLVYGGGNVGLMGVIADAVLKTGGTRLRESCPSFFVGTLAHSGQPKRRDQ
jgi:predicted Rossmann-fold nucleotide-binding protein